MTTIARRKGRWTPLGVAAVVLGFMAWWPLGLAVVAYIMWGGSIDELAQKGLDELKGAFKSGIATRGTTVFIDNSWGCIEPLFRDTQVNDVPATTLADVNACGWENCLRSSGNIENAQLSNPDPHLDIGSPLIDVGVLALDEGAPSAVATDMDGDCRYTDGSADIGADEAPDP